MNPTSLTVRSLRQLVLAASALAFVLPAGSALASPLSWLAGEKVQGNGNIKKQNREVGHFTGISMGLTGNVEVHAGAADSLSIEADENILPLVETVVENGTLKIRTIKRNMNLETRHLKLVITAREVDRIALGGSGSVEADNLHGGKLQFDLGGSGSINVKSMEAGAVTVALSGSGSFKGAGTADSLSVSIGGSGDVQAGGLKTRSVSISVGGSGQVTVWAKDQLSATIAGSGDIAYYGDPQVSKTVLGSGSVKRLGSAPQ